MDNVNIAAVNTLLGFIGLCNLVFCWPVFVRLPLAKLEIMLINFTAGCAAFFECGATIALIRSGMGHLSRQLRALLLLQLPPESRHLPHIAPLLPRGPDLLHPC